MRWSAVPLLLAASWFCASACPAEELPGYRCAWHEVAVSDGLVLPFEAELEVRRPFTSIRMPGGTFYRLEACGEPVGLVWQGEGELALEDPGPERSHLIDTRFANLPGTVPLEAAVLFATDGTIAELIRQAGAGDPSPWQSGEVPAGVYGMVRMRTAPFQPAEGRGARPSGELLWSPLPELGGLWVDARVRGIQLERPAESLTPPPRWLTVSWSPRGGAQGLEPGLWEVRTAGASVGSLLASFGEPEELADEAGPYVVRGRDRTFDLREVDVVARVGRSSTWDRDLSDVELDATLRLTALEGAEEVLGLWLLEGRARTVGEQWADARVHEVKVDGQPAPFDRLPGRLFVHLGGRPSPGAEIEVRVTYGGALLEPAGQSAFTPLAGAWYPRTEDRDRHRLTVTVAVPRFWDVAVSGRRVEEYDDGRTRVVTSRTGPEVEGGVLLIQEGDTKIWRPPHDGLPVVRVIRHPDSPPINARIGPQVYDHLEALAALLGPFPYDELEIVERRGESDAGSPGVIVLSRFDAPPDGVITTSVGTRTLLEALAMQYLQVDMGAASHNDQWLIDGLVSLAECWALERADRSGRCQASLKGKRDLWLRWQEEDAGHRLVGPLWSGVFSGFAFHNSRLRGPLVLHRLRLLMGDEPAWRLLERIARAYRGQRLSTRSFLVHAQATADADLRRFFYGWVYATPPEPVARVSWAPRRREDGTWAIELETRLDSGRDGEPQPMLSPLLLRVEVAGEPRYQRIILTEEVLRGSIEGLPTEPKKLKLDPGRTFPGETVLQRLE